MNDSDSAEEKIDVFPARPRNWMRVWLPGFEILALPAVPFAAEPVQASHAPALAQLMDVAYRGTIDHEGETPEQCLAEMQGTLQGKYGPFIESASFVILNEKRRATSACLVTLWKGAPLLAFSMTDPGSQGRGQAAFLINQSIAALQALGYKEFFLVVTEGNVRAEKLYRKLGFEFLGPARAGQQFGA